MYGNTVIIRIVDRGEADQRFASFSFPVFYIFYILVVEIMTSFAYIRKSQLTKLEFIKEDMDETVFMFALFKCRKFDKTRN